MIEHNQQPILLANEQYLLTVTALDAPLDKTPLEQAQIWSNQIERSLHNSRVERSPGHTREMVLLTGLTLVMAGTLHVSLGYLWRRSPSATSHPFFQL